MLELVLRDMEGVLALAESLCCGLDLQVTLKGGLEDSDVGRLEGGMTA